MGIPSNGQKEKMIYTFNKVTTPQEETPEEPPKEEIISSEDVVKFLSVAIFGPAIVMLTWNWTLPVLFGIKTISYFQALCLIVLTRMLLK
jgi:hypothetical protein